MKVVTSEEMTRIEKLAINEGFSESEFMENAALHVAKRARHMIASYHLQPKVGLLLGRGHNAGDALAAGSILLKGNSLVFAIALFSYENCANLTQEQWIKFENAGGKIFSASEKKDFEDAELLIDGIFGTGFKGHIEDFVKKFIEKVNHSGKVILSIDIPSGINGTTGEIAGSAIKADETLFLGLPKKGCFFDDAWLHTGQIHIKNFGLEEKYIAQAQEEFILLEKKDVAPLLPEIKKTRHKYQAGYVLGIGGSEGMQGALGLAAWSALRSGAGIVRLFHPPGVHYENLPLEIIRVAYNEDDPLIFKEMDRSSAIFIGPGMGLTAKAQSLLKNILQKIDKPLVIDADALTIIAENNLTLPKESLLTPHRGEMKRLLGIKEESKENFLQLCRHYAQKNEITLILKGSPTVIFHKNETPIISPFGDPGMATAGAGDVLTGIIASFLAQGKSPKDAAMIGVAIHGISGEMAAKKLTSYALIASDLINHLPLSFSNLMTL